MRAGKRWCIKGAMSAALFAAACSGVFADDHSGFNFVDFRFAAQAGAFIYMQEVDGGYFIDGYPYDLDWYGLIGEATGIIELSLPLLNGIGIGIGGCLQYAINPAAVNEASRFAERADTGALGGYGGLSVSYVLNDLRLNAIAGYGGTGVSSYYGGSGPAVSAGVDYTFVAEKIRFGIGTRYSLMFLSHPGSATVRSEKGPYMAFSVGAVVDWLDFWRTF